MPPHCDSMDGPVVAAARDALDHRDVTRVLPYVPEEDEHQIAEAYERAVRTRADGAEARELADLWFFETVVRVHRGGEGAPYTGLKRAGLDHGPVLPAAERALELGHVAPVVDVLCEVIRQEAGRRFDQVLTLRSGRHETVPENRTLVEATLGFEVYANQLYRCALADPHQAHQDLHAGGE